VARTPQSAGASTSEGRGPQPQSSAGGQPGYSEAQTMGASIQRLRTHLDSRLVGLRQARYGFWIHWRELATYLLPRRFTWLATPSELSRGSPLNSNIIDPTGTKASQICAAGMMSGITSPGRPWFKLSIADMDASDTSPVKLWLDEVCKRMQRVIGNSNYYTAKAQQYHDLVVFGTAPLIIIEDQEDVFRCITPCAGEYFIAASPRMTIDTLFREFVQTVAQLVAEFGEDNVSDDVARMFKQGGASLSQEIRICHAIEPNDDRVGGRVLPSRFPWREVYWQSGSNGNKVLRMRGYLEQPFSCPRWDLSGNDAYGRSPGMDALGPIKQLQLEQRRKAQAIDKMVNPPLKAHVSMRNEPAVTIPGGVTYVTDMSAANSGIAPVYEVQPRLQEMMEDIQDVRGLIGKIFFNDLFQMLAGEEKEMTAFEVAQRREEKMVVLGPVIERNENEGLDPDLDRIFAIMNRRGMIPPAPPEIHGSPLQVQYVSMLAQAQRAASTGALEQLVAFVGRLLAADPTAIDNIDIDELIDEYAEMMGASPRVVRASVAVAQIRQGRAQQQAQQQAMQVTAAGVQGANVLSQTPIGQGSALDGLLGLGGGASGGQQGEPA
jgi:Bacteriophage head to tail connecting protein